MNTLRVRVAATILIIFLTLACSEQCLAHLGASPTPSASPSSAPAISSPPLLVGLWKGFVPSLNKGVFIAWVKPKSSSSDDVQTAIDDAYTLIAPKLHATPYEIFIINVMLRDSSSSPVITTRGFIFVRDQDGRFTHTVDAAFIDKVIKAGLPTSPGTD
jgi:hypothetical protein